MPRGLHHSTVLVSGFGIFLRGCGGGGGGGDSTAASTAGFYDWAFDKHGQHRPGKLERTSQRYRERLEWLFRKRASDAFRGSGRSDQQSGESFFRQFRAGGLPNKRRAAPPCARPVITPRSALPLHSHPPHSLFFSPSINPIS